MTKSVVFIPLYGKAPDEEREIFVKKVITYQRDLWKQDKISKNLIGATMVMANKIRHIEVGISRISKYATSKII